MREELWINQTLSNEPESPGRERLLDVLEQRYRGDITNLSAVYGTSFASFSDLRKDGSLTYPRWILAVKSDGSMPARAGSTHILADAEALFGEIVEQLHKVSHAEFRKHDSNHMVLGCYVEHTTNINGIWKRIAPYIDALGPQDLSDANPIKPSVETTGLPAMLSDQEFGNLYPVARQGERGTPGAVPDHADRRVLYDVLASRIARDPDFRGVSSYTCRAPRSVPLAAGLRQGPARFLQYRRRVQSESGGHRPKCKLTNLRVSLQIPRQDLNRRASPFFL